MMIMIMMIMMMIAGLPEPPDDCRVTNETNDSLSVTCRYPYYHDNLDDNNVGDDFIKLMMKYIRNTHFPFQAVATVAILAVNIHKKDCSVIYQGIVKYLFGCVNFGAILSFEWNDSAN